MCVQPGKGRDNVNVQEYADFLASKHVAASDLGIAVEQSAINPKLFPFQRDIVQWALCRGRAAIFAECGLGKTPMQLEWARLVSGHEDAPVLILAPLAVAQQTVREGQKFDVPVARCRAQADVRPGVNVTNYDMLAHFDVDVFAGVVLDESSILKNYMGATKQALIEAFKNTKYRLCCTATPAPNDHMEIGNHSEFLGIMRSGEMLMRWFINDTMKMGSYRLKGHAEEAFYDWVATWAVSMRRPSDLGYSDEGFILPPLTMHQVNVEVDITRQAGEMLFRMPDMSATGIHKEMRLTADSRADEAARLVSGNDEPWIIWCNSNYEADALAKRLPDAVEVRGSESADAKERKLERFLAGQVRILISKPVMFGYGLNLQFCSNVVFVGLSYSFEQFYQALRRTYRFGQQRPVNAYIISAQTEGQVVAVVEQKMQAHERMMDEMNRSAHKLKFKEHLRLMDTNSAAHEAVGPHELIHGDCVSVTRNLLDDSIHFSIFSPPFSQLYTYSDAIEDMGNSAGDEEFFRHFGFLIPELHRITKPGRLCAVHCKQLVNYKGRDGMAGLRDFRGDIIRQFIDAGWAYHSEVCIWKDPVIEMQRTKAHGLLYKQLRADSTFSRQGMAEYLLLFRRWANEEEEVEPVTHTHEDFPLDVWQRYASPIWMDIRQTNVLNVQQARDAKDEKHICPLQLDVIERALELWTNPGDLVLDPFGGIGSTAYVAEKLGRRSLSIELKETYWRAAIKNVQAAYDSARQTDLFSAAGVEVEATA